MVDNTNNQKIQSSSNSLKDLLLKMSSSVKGVNGLDEDIFNARLDALKSFSNCEESDILQACRDNDYLEGTVDIKQIENLYRVVSELYEAARVDFLYKEYPGIFAERGSDRKAISVTGKAVNKCFEDPVAYFENQEFAVFKRQEDAIKQFNDLPVRQVTRHVWRTGDKELCFTNPYERGYYSRHEILAYPMLNSAHCSLLDFFSKLEAVIKSVHSEAELKQHEQRIEVEQSIKELSDFISQSIKVLDGAIKNASNESMKPVDTPQQRLQSLQGSVEVLKSPSSKQIKLSQLKQSLSKNANTLVDILTKSEKALNSQPKSRLSTLLRRIKGWVNKLFKSNLFKKVDEESSVQQIKQNVSSSGFFKPKQRSAEQCSTPRTASPLLRKR